MVLAAGARSGPPIIDNPQWAYRTAPLLHLRACWRSHCSWRRVAWYFTSIIFAVLGLLWSYCTSSPPCSWSWPVGELPSQARPTWWFSLSTVLSCNSFSSMQTIQIFTDCSRSWTKHATILLVKTYGNSLLPASIAYKVPITEKWSCLTKRCL